MNSNTNDVVMKKKTSLGRRKIEIKKIKKESSRQVTFSKRRIGLFKKASELCIVTGAEVAIIIQSPGNHVFSFGQPNVESLINRYTTDDGDDTAGGGVSHHHNITSSYVNALMNKNSAMRKELEAEKKREKFNGQYWWNEKIEDLEAAELEACIAAAEELKKNVLLKEEQLLFKEKLAVDGGVQFVESLNANMTTAADSYDYCLNYEQGSDLIDSEFLMY